jgi:hypothetical protein
MINIKLSAVVSGGAFILSLVIGLLSGAGVVALVRALILGAVFFLITGGAYWLVVKFLPELLSHPPEQPEPVAGGMEPGAQVDISLGEEEPEAFEPEAVLGENLEEPGPFSQGNAGMDQIDNIGYTREGDVDGRPSLEAPPGAAFSMENLSGERPPSSRKPAVPEDGFDSVDVLPDMDSLASVFTSSDGSGNAKVDRVFPLDISQKKGGSRRGAGKLDHDYNTNDMAAAIQTILKRD